MNQKERLCYETDASRLIGRAEKVLFPKNIEEIKSIIKNNENIVPRGAGSGFSGGTIPDGSAVADLSKMNKILNFNPLKKKVFAEAGVTIKELNDKLLALGFEFPIYPSNAGISTIGGMIATNASGNRSMKYGFVKDWIDEIEFVNGKGELIKTSKADLMEACGMEGITGIIVGASLRLIPRISRSISVFQSQSIDEILSVARRLKQEKETCMLAFFSKEVSKMLDFPEAYHLIIEFESLRGKIFGDEYQKLSKIKEMAYSALFREGYYNSEDPKLFFDSIKEFALFLEQDKIPYFGDLGTGIIHPFFKDVEKAKRAGVVELMKKMKIKTGRYGYGITRRHFLDSFDAKIIQRIKSRQDPMNKLNLKKVILETEKISDIYRDRKPIEKVSAKTPDEKLNELIKEAEKVEKKEVRSEFEKFDERKEAEIENEIMERLEDYENTFELEPSPEKIKNAENFAKQVPKQSLERESVKQQSLVDYNLINSIMTNKDKANGRVSVSDNLERQVPVNPKKRDVSQDEKDIINKILGNRYKKDNGNKNEEESK